MIYSILKQVNEYVYMKDNLFMNVKEDDHCEFSCIQSNSEDSLNKSISKSLHTDKHVSVPESSFSSNLFLTSSSEPVQSAEISSSSITTFEKMLSAGVGAILTSLMVTPFDLVKTRMQSIETLKENDKLSRFSYSTIVTNSMNVKGNHHQVNNLHGNHNYHHSKNINQNSSLKIYGIWDGIKKISSAEGFFALWRGTVPTLIMAIPSTVIYYTSYEYIRDTITPFFNSVNLAIYAPLVAGSTARAGASIATSPLELIRTRMQSGDPNQRKLKGALSSLSKSFRSEGMHVLWTGLGSTLWRDIPFSAIYWLSYESLKTKYTPSSDDHDTSFTLRHSFLFGAVSGMIAATLTTPFDVAKTVQQVSASNQLQLNQLLFTIIKRDGVQGLFKGLSPRIAKVAPACAIMISSYEAGKIYFKK